MTITISHFRPWLLLLLALICVACDRAPWKNGTRLEPVEPAAREAVVAGVFRRMNAGHQEKASRFVKDLPMMKDLAAKEAGFESWTEFRRRVRQTEPDRDLEIARKITSRIRELLDAGREEAEVR